MNLEDIMEASLTGPTKFALHSIPGFGKTTLAAEFPAPVFQSPENGFPRDLPYRPRVLPRADKLQDIYGHVKFLTFERHPFKSYVLDTADWLEPLIHRYVCERDSGRKTELNKSGHKLISIEDYGYGRGYTAAEEEFREYIRMLDLMQHERGMHVVILMHTQIKKFNNPTGPDFDQYVPKVAKGIAAIISEWAENLFFGHYDIDAAKLSNESKAKATYSGKRLLGTRATASYDAKNRIGLKGLIELEDPRELIPYLLGERVAARQYDSPPANDTVPQGRETPSGTQTGDRAPRTREEEKEQRQKERADEERIARNFEADAKRNFEPIAEENRGKSAMHADRQADEQRRQDEAFAEQRKRNEEKAAREKAEYEERQREAKRQNSEWTEPKRPEPQSESAPSSKPAASEGDRIAKLTKLIERAGNEKGPEYRKKVEKWTKGAKGDPAKIDAIIEDVENTLNGAA